MGRKVRRGLAVLGLIVGIQVVLIAISRLPDGTDVGALVLRGLFGLSIGLVFVMIVRRMLGAMADPPPPALATVDASSAEVVYECPTCGTRVRLELAATAKAPRHCGEEMEPSVRAR